MNRIYRSITVMAGLAVSIIGLVAVAPAAFAMRLVDTGDSAPYATPATVVHSGASTWEVVLIAALAAVAAAAGTAIAVTAHGRTTKLGRETV
jgi:hypothetical protein